MKHQKLLAMNLHLFEGGGAAGGAGAGAGAAAPGGTAGAMGDTQAGSVNTQQGNNKSGDLSQVRYGKQAGSTTAAAGQAAAQAPAAGAANNPQGAASASDTLEARQREFDELVNSDRFKDIYTKRTQDMIDRRFSKAKAAEAENSRLREIAAMLNQRYGVTDDADFSKLKTAIEEDDGTWAAAAEEAGMTVEQFRKFDAVQKKAAAWDAARENDVRAMQQRAKAQAWYNEAQTLKAKFPDFDLGKELQDPNFRASIQAGVSMEQTYKGKYFDQFMGEAQKATAAATEKNLVNNIRAKGQRPAENGANSQSASFTTKSDPSKLTLADFEEIARRVAHGEVISF